MLLTLAMGIYDFGRGESANITVTNSAREGARLIVAQATQHGRTDGSPTAFYSVITCPGGTASAPTAPPAGSAQGAAWRQLNNANLDLTKVSKIEARFYAANHDPSTSAADNTFTCTPGGGATPTEVRVATYTISSGDWVQFQVDYTFKPATPLISAIVSNVTVSQVTTMVLD
jgi:hypothetical protein